jgi:para-aminobenzoate synthetase component 1
VIKSWDDPMKVLGELDSPASDCAVAAGQRPGRWAGFLSYDLGRLFERLPSTAESDLQLPLFAFAFCPASRKDETDLSRETTFDPIDPRHEECRSTFSSAAYRATVNRVLEYIQAGDIFQANLSQRFTVRQRQSAAHIYDRLLKISPARFGGLLDFGDFALICNSPELFLKVFIDEKTGSRRVITRPIKGTRPRKDGMEVELRDSIKDQAELNMIVDLERNDLGKVCRIGAVKVTEARTVESHPTVYHGVATVEGTLRPDVGFVDLLRATFPGGSVTGAPKIRAMEIIEELEPVRRGPYCGAIGSIASDGSLEFNVAIRTMIVKDGLIHIPVGGGIVADSDAAEEYDETLVKAKAMFAALGD